MVDKKEKETKLCGEITAFLSLVFLLILALVGTALESARVNVGQSFADRSVQNAMESLYTQYCFPLWEDYHVFFLEGEKEEKEEKDYIRNSLLGYMDTTYAGQDMKLSSLNLMDMEIHQIEIEDIVRANEYEGELLLHQILEYEKYQIDDIFLANQKKSIQAMKEMNASMAVIEKQLEAEEKMAAVNLETLKFISLIEGLAIGKNGLRWKGNGVLKTEKYFVKQFCGSDITPNAVGIQNEVVWKSLQQSYINPVLIIEQMETQALKLLAELEAEEAEEKAEGTQAEGGEPVKQKNSMITYIKLKHLEEEFIETAKGILGKAKKADGILSEIRAKQSVFMEETKELEEVYRKQKPNLSAESQTAFEEEIERLKGFAKLEKNETDSIISTILNMRSYLENNIEILNEILRLGNSRVNNTSEGISYYLQKISKMKEKLRSYRIKEMQFDYSSLFIGKEMEDPTEILSEGYENKLLEWVVKDTSLISQKSRDTQSLKYGESEIGSIEGLTDVDEQLKRILLSCYVESHFSSYLRQVTEKETMLDYEVEYILEGRRSDKENLEEVIKKLVKVRTLFNYLYLMTDREKVEMAHGTAVALVGYSCMEPLIQLTKNLILLTWATEEAVVDTAVLLQDGEVPIFKNKVTFMISFEELFLFGKELVQKKADKLTEIMSDTGMNYEEYLNFLLSITDKKQKLNGIMELMEDNMRIRYDSDFIFANCIYGIEVIAKFHMKEKFVSLPGVQNVLSTGGEGFEIQSHQSYCYE